MNTFTFDSKLKTTLIAFMALGLICLIASWFAEPEVIAEANVHQRFWSNLLHNATFFTGIAFIALFTYTAWTTAWAGWYSQFKRVYEAYAAFLIPGFILMLIIAGGIWMHWHHLYHWADESLIPKFLDNGEPNPNYDRIISGKSSFLNKNWYTFGTIIILGFWIFCYTKLRGLSLDEDQNGRNGGRTHHDKIRVWSAIFLPFAGFSICAIIWQWLMSIDAHWYSTMYAWYNMASLFVAMTAMTILTIIWLKSKGYYQNVTQEHLHDLGKFLFAFSVFWTYLWFSQYMLIWYANNGEETIYFNVRREQFPVLHYGNLIINFALPFLILMRNSTKRKYGTLVFVSIITFFGHWWDYFYMIKPGTLHTAQELIGGDSHDHAHGMVEGFTIPGLLELGTGLGFLAFFLFVAFNALSKAALVPKYDPYLEESMHHEVLQGEGEHAH